MPDPTLPLFPPERKIWSVSALAARIKQNLEREFFDVWVEGEISNLHRSPAGHYYFTLKDAGAQLRAALFAGTARLVRIPLRDGLLALARGRVSYYETRGDLQCYVEHIEARGEGDLRAAFERLKAKLEAEGLFAAARKRPLPLLPRRVALVTSPRGAAVADMIRILRRRYPNLSVLVAPVAVQGAGAAAEIRAAVARLAGEETPPAARPDVIIVGRGGGSLEDLWAFNDEALARVIAASPIPVISAVGHETDFTICDFVADLRAPTPSAAAELVIRPKPEMLGDWEETRRRLAQALRFSLARRRRELMELTQHRAFPSLRARLARRAQGVDELDFRLREAVRRGPAALWRRLERAAARLRQQDARRRLALRRAELTGRAEAMTSAFRLRLAESRRRLEGWERVLAERNPLAVLARGYALVYREGGGAERRLVTSAAQVARGEELRVRLAAGWIEAEVTATGDGADEERR